MKKLTIAVILVLIISLIGAVIFRALGLGGETIEVVHWTNGHLMRPGLMPEMAKRFNDNVNRTQSGKRIQVKILNHGSAEQSDDLTSRINLGIPVEREFPNPVIVTPSSADWLVRANYATGRTIVDTAASRSIARALIGIVTYRDMAEALGWPQKEIGYGDIIDLRNDPRGWASYSGAKAEWGQRPLVAFTDPVTSTTGRSVLFSLYAIAAGKTPEQLTEADVSDPEVVSYVKQFQSLIDHYMIGTIPLNTKVYQSPESGHFFLMPEDNLIHLYEGTEHAFINGVDVQAPPIEEPMVMIYPKEGAMVRNNIAGIVQAPWVTPEQVEAAEKWIDFLLQDEQQQAFMSAGFRPGSNLSLDTPASRINGKFGLDATPHPQLLVPERIDPAVAATIEQSWQDVKKQGIVTFVLDTSGSMAGSKIQQAKEGMTHALDGMAKNNQVGFLTFSDTINTRVPVAPLPENRFLITEAVQKINAQGATALYDSLKDGIEMTDSVSGSPDAIRAVVVLTDGQANQGQSQLDTIVRMTSINEIPIQRFRGFQGDSAAQEEGGRSVLKKEIIGSGLAIETRNPIQIFFIGIGKDADMEVGRILSQATGAEFQGASEKDLAKVLEEFSKYF